MPFITPTTPSISPKEADRQPVFEPIDGLFEIGLW